MKTFMVKVSAAYNVVKRSKHNKCVLNFSFNL